MAERNPIRRTGEAIGGILALATLATDAYIAIQGPYSTEGPYSTTGFGNLSTYIGIVGLKIAGITAVGSLLSAAAFHIGPDDPPSDGYSGWM